MKMAKEKLTQKQTQMCKKRKKSIRSKENFKFPPLENMKTCCRKLCIQISR